MQVYSDRMDELRTALENPSHRQDTRPVESLIEEVLLLISEDNIVTTQIRLEKSFYTSICPQISAMREFLDQQRFVFKILFDSFNKSY